MGAHLALLGLVHLAEDVLGVGLQRREAGGFGGRRRQLLGLLALLLPAFLHLGHLGGLGRLGHLGRLGGLGGLLPGGLVAAGRGRVGGAVGLLLPVRVRGGGLLHGHLGAAGLALHRLGGVLRHTDLPGQVLDELGGLHVLRELVLVFQQGLTTENHRVLA